jgi:hypothetical protein
MHHVPQSQQMQLMKEAQQHKIAKSLCSEKDIDEPTIILLLAQDGIGCGN